MASGLHDEAVAPAHILVQAGHQFPIRERLGATLTQGNVQYLADALGQFLAVAARKHLQMIGIGTAHALASAGVTLRRGAAAAVVVGPFSAPPQTGPRRACRGREPIVFGELLMRVGAMKRGRCGCPDG